MATISPDRDLPPLPQDPPQQRNASARMSTGDSSSSSLVSRTTSGSRSTRTSERLRPRDGLGHHEVLQAFQKLNFQLSEEKRRADNAELKLSDAMGHLKTINDARLLAMQDAARAKEELRLYKVQLDTAQQEIFRAQDVIGVVDRQRHAAEKEAAKNRSRARQLNETIMIQAAREEAWRLGMQEGLDRGRDIALAELPLASYSGSKGVVDHGDEYSFDETRTPTPEQDERPPFQTRPRSITAGSHYSKPPSMREQPRATSSPNPIPVSLPPILPTAPPSAPPSIAPRSRPPSVHPSEQIRPISFRGPSPTPRMSHVFVPPDNLIPSLDADNRIRIPAPYGFSRTPEPAPLQQLPPPSSERALSDSSQEPLPIPPRSQDSQRQRYHRRNSSSDSSALSALDIINEPFGGALRTPMSAIPEVLSQHSGSPLPPGSVDGDHSMRHQRSMSENSMQPSLHYAPSISQMMDTQNQHQLRPQSSRTSYAGSYSQPPQPAPSSNRRSVSNSNVSSPPGISVQPPSRPLSHKTDSFRGGSSRGGGSPMSQQRVPLPTLAEASSNEPHYVSSPSNRMPGGLNTDSVYSYSTPFENNQGPSPTEGPSSSRRGREGRSRRSHNGYDRNDYDDDAVSSAMSGDTLTTPPSKYRSFGQERRQPDDWSSAVGMAENIPIRSDVGHIGGNGLGSSSTAIWNEPPPEPEPEYAASTVGSTKTGGKKKKSKR